MSGGVLPSSRAKSRRRPASKSVRQAVSLFERFTGHEATNATRVIVKSLPKTAVYIGTCDGLLYTTVRDGKTEKYIHKFAAKDKPVFAVSPDGRQILLLGGAYRFTERGIVDASDKSG